MKKLVIGSALVVSLLFSGAGQSSANSSPAGMNGMDINGVDLGSMDLETALSMLQSRRASLLDDHQLEVQEGNEAIAKLNDQLSSLNAERSKTTDTNKLNELAAQISRIKNQIDEIENSQQMEMRRLQTILNKHNEAIDLTTNFLKKMQEKRSSIIGSMR